MPSILDYDFGSKLNKFVEKIPKFDLKGCFGTSKPSYVSQTSVEPVDIRATMQELSHRLIQNAIAVPTKQAYKVAKALSSQYPNDIGMKYLTVNLSTFPEEVLGYNSIEELRQSCLRQFPDSYAKEFFKRDMVRLSSQGDMDVEFLTKVAATITSQLDFERKVKQLNFEGSDTLNVDKRQFLLAHINESLSIEDTFPCDAVVEEEHLGYIKNSHKKYMADVYKAEIAENLQRVMEKNPTLDIPDAIDFSRGIEEELYFGVETPEYQMLMKFFNDDSAWEGYLDEMDLVGVNIFYSKSKDAFKITSAEYIDSSNEHEANVYEIPEEIDFRTCTASMSLKVGSDRVEYHLLNNLWNDEVTKDTYCAEMKNAGVIVAYNEDDTYTIEKECDNTIDTPNEHTAALDIPNEIDFSYYDGEILYFGADTVEYQLLSELDEDAWIEYLDEMATVGVAVEYDSVDDVFEVESSLYGDVEEEEEEHEAKKKSTKSYEVPKEIDYRNYTSAIPLRFGTNTAEYKLLNGLSKAELTKYKEEMSKNGVAVTYDEKLDKFIIQNGIKTADKIEKIWVVEKPKTESIIEDILWESTIGGLENQFKGGLSKNDIAATFTTEVEAKEFAEKLLKEKTAYNKKASDEAQEAYNLGVKAGESDAWMIESLEDGEKQLRKDSNKADDLSDLLSTWEQGWEQTDHWNIKYGNILQALQGGEYGEYISDFWEGFHNGLTKRNINLYEIGKKLLKESNTTSNKKADIDNKNVVKIIPENQGYDISVYINGEKVKSNWKKDYQSAYQAARIFADFYKAENGQSLDIKPYHSIESKKADLIPTPVNMPEQEIYTRLTNETKDALSKIQSRASDLKTLRDEHLQVHGELDEAKNKLAEEKQRISAELSGYLDISGNSFTKICVALTVAETLEAQEEVILNAITTSIDKVIEANEKAIPEDATNILDILKHMGTIVDNMVFETKEDLKIMTEGINYVKQAVRKKQAMVDEIKFWPWIKTSIFGAKKFYGFADRNVDSFINDYGNLVKILLNY